MKISSSHETLQKRDVHNIYLVAISSECFAASCGLPFRLLVDSLLLNDVVGPVASSVAAMFNCY